MGPIKFLLRQLCSKSSLRPTKTRAFNSLFINRSYTSYPRRPGRAPDSQLYTRITLFGSSNVSVTPLLDQWAEEGNKVSEVELRSLVRLLRARYRYSQALEVSEWMGTKKLCPFLSSDHAVKLDLIGKVRGIDAAEDYFKEFGERSERMYGSLLNCYVRESLVEKSLSHFETMKNLGIARCSLTYNNIMNLYVNTGQPEKAHDMLVEMKREGILPDQVSYRLCMKACESKSDFDNMEMILKEMESQPHIVMDSAAYTTMAGIYTKGGHKDKALQYLKKAEDLANRDPRSYRYFITMYTNLGETSEVFRLWKMLKDSRHGIRLVNVDYVNILSSVLKLGKLEEAEKIFKDWESADTLYDFRVPNVLLLGYTRIGLVEKAEKMLEAIVESGKAPIPNSWSIISAGYIDRKDMEKAFECMKQALSLAPRRRGWLPKPDNITCILEWLGEEGDICQVEAFVESLKQVVPVEKCMYHALIKANIRHGNGVDAILQRMKNDNIEEDEETKTILAFSPGNKLGSAGTD
ncbi:hypothetical protein V2J09_007335 [Rumex salicifolius]